jgi:hypothetical protein
MNFICPVVMALIIVLSYRTLRGTLLPLCVIGGASLSALGLMALANVPVYIVTNGIFVVIMAVTYARGIEADCGCFGIGEPISPLTLLRDTLFIIPAAFLVAQPWFEARRRMEPGDF